MRIARFIATSLFSAAKMSKGKQVTMSTFPRGKTDAPLTLFIYATMNGYKAPILCEELGIEYNYVTIDFEKGEQKSLEYLAINPNGRIPAIYDADHDVFVAESAAILEYIATKYRDKNPALLPSPDDDLARHWEVRQWMLFAATGLSPAMGNAMFFNRIAATKGEVNEYSIHRYTNESRRCLEVLNEQLQKSGGPYLLGNDLTIADINAFTYASTHFWAKVDVSGLDELNAWIKLLMERRGFQRGLEIPFARRGFFGPPFATQEEIEAEIQRNAGQFTVTGGSAGAAKGEGERE